MTMTLQAQAQVITVPWGRIVFHLDHEAFRKGYESGRAWYFKDCAGEQPHRATSLTSEELLRLIVVPDEHRRYRFDETGLDYLEEYLGIFLGYMSGPAFAQTLEERQEYSIAIMPLPDTL